LVGSGDVGRADDDTELAALVDIATVAFHDESARPSGDLRRGTGAHDGTVKLAVAPANSPVAIGTSAVVTPTQSSVSRSPP
jgi:hypothetical protein